MYWKLSTNCCTRSGNAVHCRCKGVFPSGSWLSVSSFCGWSGSVGVRVDRWVCSRSPSLCGRRKVPCRIASALELVALKSMVKSSGREVQVQSFDWLKCSCLWACSRVVIVFGQSTHLQWEQVLGWSSGFSGTNKWDNPPSFRKFRAC